MVAEPLLIPAQAAVLEVTDDAITGTVKVPLPELAEPQVPVTAQRYTYPFIPVVAPVTVNVVVVAPL